MKSASIHFPAIAGATGTAGHAAAARPSVIKRFGNTVDVRNRGALRLMRLVGIQVPGEDAPAVVRIWHGDTCRELAVGEARALAAQLFEAAEYAEHQNHG